MADPARAEKRTKREIYELLKQNCLEEKCGSAKRGWPKCVNCFYLGDILRKDENDRN